MTTTAATIAANAASTTFGARIMDFVPGAEIIPALAAGLVMVLSLGQIF